MVVLLLVLILLGAALQRITGMGFALVAGPFLVLLVGPLPGVLLVNMCGAFSSLIIMSRVWRGIEWRRYALLAPPAVIGVVLGALVLDSLPKAWIEVVVGGLVILGMSVSLLASKAPAATGPSPALLAGFMSGAMSVTAGTGGPAIAVYAVAARWNPKAFAATVQPYFVTVAATSVAAKLLLTSAVPPTLVTAEWIGLLIALITGVVAGDLIAPRVSTRATRLLLVALAYVGGTATLVRGIITLAPY